MAKPGSSDDGADLEDDSPDQPPASGAVPVSFFSADEVVFVGRGEPLVAAAERLVAAEVGLLVVGSVDAVEGVVSERDLVRAVAGRAPAETTVGDIATTDLVWCDVTATVNEVAMQMMSRYLRHVLVEEDGRLVGIVSARDLLGAYATGAG